MPTPTQTRLTELYQRLNDELIATNDLRVVSSFADNTHKLREAMERHDCIDAADDIDYAALVKTRRGRRIILKTMGGYLDKKYK